MDANQTVRDDLIVHDCSGMSDSSIVSQPDEINVLVMYFARALTLINTPTDFVKTVDMAKEIRQTKGGQCK